MAELVTQRVDVPMGGGLQEAVDKHWTPAGSFLRLENWVFDQAGALRKRHGYGRLANTLPGGGTLPVCFKVDVRGNELVAIGTSATDHAPRLHSWNDALGRWTDKDDVCPVSVHRSPVVRARSKADGPQVCIANGLEVYTWFVDPVVDPINNGIYIKAIDPATGAIVVNDTLLVSSLTNAGHATFACGTSVIIVYAVGTQIVARKWNAVTLATASITILATSAGELFYFDAIPYGAAQFVVAWVDLYDSTTKASFEVALYTLSSMTVAASDTVTETEFGAISLAADAAQNIIAVAVADYLAPWHYVRLVTYTGLLAGPLHNIKAYDAGLAALSTVIESTAVGINPNGSFVVMFDGSVGTLPGVFIAPVNVGGAGTPNPTDEPRRSLRARILSRPFVQDGATYCLLSGNDRPTGITTQANDFHAAMLVRLDDTTSLTEPLRLEAAFCVGDAYTPASSPLRPKPSVVATATAGQLLTAPLVMTSGTTAGSNVAAILTDSTAMGGVDRVLLDFTAPQPALWHSAQAQGLLVQSGGFAGSYDGQGVVEVGFLAAPLLSEVHVAGSPGDGAIEGADAPTNSYGYVAVFEWTDAQGNLHQSAPSNIGTVSVSAAQTLARTEIDLGGLPYTRRGDVGNGANRDVTIAVFRTLKNAPEVYYRIKPRLSPAALNDRIGLAATAHDTLSDTQLLRSGYGVLYTSGGVLENFPPGPVRAVLRHRDRVWMVSADDDRSVFYSKSLVQGEAPGFHPGFSIRVDGESGVVAVAGLDDKVVFFTATSIFYVVGDGPSDNGAGGLYAGPYPVAADSGCIDPRSVVAFPGGVAFQSAGGIRVLTRGLTVETPGLAVEKTLERFPTLAGAVVDGTREWLIWLASNDDGESCFIVWDYGHAAWSTWVISGSAQQYSHVLWRGYHVYSDALAVCREGYGAAPGYDPGENYPEGWLEYPWLHPGDAINGLVRVRHLLFAIQRLGDCFLTVSTFTDWNESTSADSQGFDFTSTSDVQGLTSTAILDMHLGEQKCSVMKVLLHDTGPGRGGDAANPTGLLVAGMTLEVGVKKGRPYVSSTNRK